jgi:hypothetical protein
MRLILLLEITRSIELAGFTCVDFKYGINRAISNQSGSKRDHPQTRHYHSHRSRHYEPCYHEHATNHNSESSVAFTNIVFHDFLASLCES